jgi:hypothetical protein
MRRAVCCLVPALVAVALFGQPAFFRDQKVSVVGELKYGQTSDKIEYANKPPYVAVYFDGQTGDVVDIKITSINGQAMAALTDSQYKPIVSSFGSHVTAVLTPGPEPYPNRYFIIMQEERGKPATFTVSLQKIGANATAAQLDYLSCNVDSDCVAVPQAGCCNNGYKAAVNKDKIDSYRSANTCKIKNVICPQIFVEDRRLAQCNRTSHQCEMIEPPPAKP